MIEIPISGRRLLEVAKRVRARVLEDGAQDGNGRPKRYPTDAELAALIQAEIEHTREAHRERMRAYYRRRRAAAGTDGKTNGNAADKRKASKAPQAPRRRAKAD